MGIGGMLMWTSVIRELSLYHKKKVFVIGNKKKHVIHEILKNNPYISNNDSDDVIILSISKTPEQLNKQDWVVDKHSILTRYEYFNLKNDNIKCEIYFTTEEIEKINELRKILPRKFIVIEPHAKTSWCDSKRYSFKKWQYIIDNIYKDLPVVQMSIPGKKILNNVIDISDKISSFREAALLLKYCELFVSAEGGLMHACNAVNTPCVILFPPLFDPIFTKYENVTDIWIRDENHFNCFKTKNCKECLNLMKNHDPNEVISKINNKIRPFYSGSPNIDF
jgi:hypothetical protein